MVFSSLVFLFAYLAVTLVIYYAVPRKARNIFLFFINLLFYGWGEPMLVFLMVFNIFFNYLGGYLVDKFRSDQKKKKLFLILTCALDIGILAVFKYTGLIVDTVNLLPFLNIPTVQISLPIGISFYTFQTMSYVIDVYRNDAPVSRSFINFGTYVALFPQLIAGPIVRYRDVAYQLEHRRETPRPLHQGRKALLRRTGQEGSHRKPDGRADLGDVLEYGGERSARHMGGNFSLHLPDLLRLLGLFRHGVRSGQYVRL